MVKMTEQEMNDGIAGIYVSMSDPNSLVSDKDLHMLLKKSKRRVSVHSEDFYELVGDDDGIFGCMSLMACEDHCPKHLPLQNKISKSPSLNPPLI